MDDENLKEIVITLRVCPECGYIEGIEWRPTTWKSAQYIDCCRMSELEQINPELAKRIKEAHPKTVIEKHYAYHMTKPQVWVIRRWIEIYKLQGWKEIDAEKYIPKDPFQQKLFSQV